MTCYYILHFTDCPNDKFNFHQPIRLIGEDGGCTIESVDIEFNDENLIWFNMYGIDENIMNEETAGVIILLREREVIGRRTILLPDDSREDIDEWIEMKIYNDQMNGGER